MKTEPLEKTSRKLTEEIIEKAVSLGASLAGVADMETLADSPSFPKTGEAFPPGHARSAIVMALEHAEDDPSMDWWDGNQGSRGNRSLIKTSRSLRRWLKRKHGIASKDAHYYVHKGGVFLKDAAVLAGLGVIGRNNLLVTPRFGPRVRLRAMFAFAPLLPGEIPTGFAPCETCQAPCRTACPRNAFDSGSYDRLACEQEMRHDEIAKRVFKDVGIMHYAGSWIKYCRACELACPVGRRSLEPLARDNGNAEQKP